MQLSIKSSKNRKIISFSISCRKTYKNGFKVSCNIIFFLLFSPMLSMVTIIDPTTTEKLLY